MGNKTLSLTFDLRQTGEMPWCLKAKYYQNKFDKQCLCHYVFLVVFLECLFLVLNVFPEKYVYIFVQNVLFHSDSVCAIFYHGWNVSVLFHFMDPFYFIILNVYSFCHSFIFSSEPHNSRYNFKEMYVLLHKLYMLIATFCLCHFHFVAFKKYIRDIPIGLSQRMSVTCILT